MPAARQSALERVSEELAAVMNGAAAVPERASLAKMIAAARQAGIKEMTLAQAVAKGLGIPFVENPSRLSPSAEFLNAVPIASARQHRVLGLMGENDTLLIAL